MISYVVITPNHSIKSLLISNNIFIIIIIIYDEAICTVKKLLYTCSEEDMKYIKYCNQNIHSIIHILYIILIHNDISKKIVISYYLLFNNSINIHIYTYVYVFILQFTEMLREKIKLIKNFKGETIHLIKYHVEFRFL